MLAAIDLARRCRLEVPRRPEARIASDLRLEARQGEQVGAGRVTIHRVDRQDIVTEIQQAQLCRDIGVLEHDR